MSVSYQHLCSRSAQAKSRVLCAGIMCIPASPIRALPLFTICNLQWPFTLPESAQGCLAALGAASPFAFLTAAFSP